MPLYVYVCPACEISFDEDRPASMANLPVECPLCSGFCERRFTPPGISRRHEDGAFEDVEQDAAGRPVVAHGPGCPCCAGRP